MVVTQAILSLLLAVPTWLLTHLPTFTYPPWFSGTHPCPGVLTVACYAHDYVGQNLRAWDSWVPAQLLLDCIGVVLVAVVAKSGIRIARMIVSMFTGGGGATS